MFWVFRLLYFCIVGDFFCGVGIFILLFLRKFGDRYEDREGFEWYEG